MTKIIELRPNTNLINHNFDKYQFSSDSVSVKVQKRLTKDVYRQEPRNSQDSWLEARLFAFHNHLFKNPFDASCWFVDESKDVWKLTSDGSLELIHKLSAPTNDELTYNPSIAFASSEVIVLSNGGLDNLDIWMYNGGSLKERFTIDIEDAGVILDARYIHEKSILIVAMCTIVQVDEKKCSQLTISSYKYHPIREKSSINALIFLRKQIFNVKGPIEYAYIEAIGDFIHLMSQDTAVLAFDSEKKADTRNTISNTDTKEIKMPKYYWSQDEDSLTVWVKIPENNRQDKAKIDVTSASIVISMKDTVLMQGDSQHRLDPELTTWKLEGDRIQLDLVKCESGLMWSELIKGDTGGENLPNAELAAEIHRRFEHLCTSDPHARDGEPMVGFNAEQLEECDLEGKDNFLQRINLDDNSTTHLVMLGTSNRLLFTHKLQSGQALCLRHDHHGVIWIPEEDEANEWIIRHVDTFPGFGYVEASKTNKKFCVSPPNLSYVAIVEHAALALLYEKPKADALIAKQRIFELDPEAAPIMGAIATNKRLILLTKNEIYDLEVFP